MLMVRHWASALLFLLYLATGASAGEIPGLCTKDVSGVPREVIASMQLLHRTQATADGSEHSTTSPDAPSAERGRTWMRNHFLKRPRLLPNGKPEDSRFSWWSFCHSKLHALGIIDELLKLNQGKSCCGSEDSGECRVTFVDMRTREAMVDGVICEIPKDVKPHPIENLSNDLIKSCSDKSLAVVCASASNPDPALPGRCSSTIYCVGVEPPKT